MTDAALEIRRVEYTYRRDVALRGVSLCVRRQLSTEPKIEQDRRAWQGR